LTDAEWRLVAPLLPAPKQTSRPLSWPLREIVNAIFYVMRGGVGWRLLPSDFPPKRTAYRWFAAWRDKGVFEALNHALLMIDRERNGRAASPSACIIDSQSGDRCRDIGLVGRHRRRAPAHLDGRRRQFALHRRRPMHQFGSLAPIVPKS
jgi:transposase